MKSQASKVTASKVKQEIELLLVYAWTCDSGIINSTTNDLKYQ